MPNARARCRGQAPQPRSGAPKAQGLTAATRSAARSGVPSLAIHHAKIAEFHQGGRARSDLRYTKNLHQLDGHDRAEGNADPQNTVRTQSREAVSRAQARIQ